MNRIIGIVASLFTIIVGSLVIYSKCIEPKRKKTQLKELLKMIEEWFDLIDINLDKSLNLAELNNKERKIDDYISNNLKNYKIKPTRNIIRKWNKKMGYEKNLLDSNDIFQRYSRVPAKGIEIDVFFMRLIGAFYSFYNSYNSDSKKDRNFADIEMPVRFFKFYVENL